MNAAEYERALAKLKKAHAAQGDNPGSYRCSGCKACAGCIFCRDCDACYKCTYCHQCSGCSHCSHSIDCDACHGSSYSIACANCTGSTYLINCHACSDCTYCFGCVGLIKQEFHILNVQYTREEYFRITRRLSAELGLPSTP